MPRLFRKVSFFQFILFIFLFYHISFLRVSHYYTFNIKSQVSRILKRVDRIDTSITNQNNMSDEFDGKIYKSFQSTNNSKEKVVSFTLNSDGVEFGSCTNLSLWPVYLVINEISLNERFSFQNIIVAGLAVTYHKPDRKAFIRPIVDQLKQLEVGTAFILKNGREDIVKCFLLYGIFDKPARSHFLNTKLCTGFYGCIRCYQRGESFMSPMNSKILNYLKNLNIFIHVYYNN